MCIAPPTPGWRDLAEQLTPKQIEWLTKFEDGGRPPEELLNTAQKLASARWERQDINARVTAALESTGLEEGCRAHYLRMTETMIGVMGLQALTTAELVALNGLLVPAHSRFLTAARVEGRRRRGEPRRGRGTDPPPSAS
ncbi:hypothetical protein [Mycobacterium sp. M23085]|uniref:hypothetical protein n=1 Tax=Mycobacterium sp. M23085 TaxID=3378087 RepID=UPI003878440F